MAETPDPNDLWALPDFIVRPLSRGTFLLIRSDNGAAAPLEDNWKSFLRGLTRFRSLKDHADSIVQAPLDPQSLNRYSYCRNNPLMYADPSGNFWWFIIPIIIGAIIGGISAAQTGGNILQGVLMGAACAAVAVIAASFIAPLYLAEMAPLSARGIQRGQTERAAPKARAKIPGCKTGGMACRRLPRNEHSGVGYALGRVR